MTHTHFSRAFTPGLRLERPEEVLTIEVVTLGELTVGADGVWLFDPGFDRVDPPLALPAGTWRVEASVVTGVSRGTGERQQVVAALQLSRGQASTWEDVATVSCDSGLIAFSTSADETLDADEADGLFAQGARTFASRAGYGDGGYGVFLGRDARGEPVSCTVDFFVLVAPLTKVFTLTAERLAQPGPLIDVVLDAFGLEVEVLAPPGLLSLDATGRTSEEVTQFVVRAFDAAGEPLFVGYTSQALRWSFVHPGPQLARAELEFQYGVEAL